METTHILILISIGVTLILGLIGIHRGAKTDSRNEGKWQGELEGRVDGLSHSIENLTKRVNSLFRLIVFGEMSDELFASSSPINLTEAGKKIADELNFDELIESLVPTILERTEKRAPYEIEVACLTYALEELEPLLLSTDPEKSDRISMVAYNHGLAREAVLRVFGISLRDRVIKEIESADS